MTVKSTRKENGVNPMEVDRVGHDHYTPCCTSGKVEETKLAAASKGEVTAKPCTMEPPKVGPQGSVEGVAEPSFLPELAHIEPPEYLLDPPGLAEEIPGELGGGRIRWGGGRTLAGWE